jgi:hypothetical protein
MLMHGTVDSRELSLHLLNISELSTLSQLGDGQADSSGYFSMTAFKNSSKSRTVQGSARARHTASQNADW